MPSATNALPPSEDALRAESRALQTALAEREKELSSTRRKLDSALHQIEQLEFKLNRAFQRLYGRSSEILDPNQLTLFGGVDVIPVLDTDEAATEDQAPRRKKKKAKGHGREPFPEHLPRNEIMVDVDDEQKLCDCEQCKGREKIRIGEEVTERGDYIPGKLVVNRYVRPKWACRFGHDGVVAADAPPALLEKVKYETSMYAHIGNAKFGDHVPLNRLSGIFKRLGHKVPTSTMWDMVRRMAELVSPIVDQIKRELLSGHYLHVDETPIQVSVKGQGTKKGYLWVWRRDKKMLFQFTMSRSRAGPLEFLGDWTGLLQKDDYSGYDAVVKRNGIIPFGCMAHARRRFKDAREVSRVQCDVALRWIGRLYRIEDRMKQRAREGNLTWDEFLELRRAKRQSRMKRDMERLKEQIDAWSDDPDVLPKSPLGGAVRYMRELWTDLARFLDYPEVEIDNNRAENAIRPVAMGRRNWMFTGSPKGGECCATMYSLVGICKALELNPEAYLLDVLGRLSTTPASRVHELTPWAWAEARQVAAMESEQQETSAATPQTALT